MTKQVSNSCCAEAILKIIEVPSYYQLPSHQHMMHGQETLTKPYKT